MTFHMQLFVWFHKDRHKKTFVRSFLSVAQNSYIVAGPHSLYEKHRRLKRKFRYGVVYFNVDVFL